MNKNVRIAKEILKVAKSLMAGEFDESVTAGEFDESVTAGKFDEGEESTSEEIIEDLCKKAFDSLLDKFKEDIGNLNMDNIDSKSFYIQGFNKNEGDFTVGFDVRIQKSGSRDVEVRLASLVNIKGSNSIPTVSDYSFLTIKNGMNSEGEQIASKIEQWLKKVSKAMPEFLVEEVNKKLEEMKK